MIRILLIFGLVLNFFISFAQTADEGKKMMDYEKYDAASKIFSSLIQANEGDAENYYMRGICQFRILKKDLAKADFEKGSAIASNPGKAALNFCGIGLLMLDAGKMEEAKAAFAKALQMTESKDAKVYDAIGYAYTYADNNPNYKLAIENLEKAVSIDKKSTLYLIHLGDAYSGLLEGGGKAVSNYEKALGLNANLAIAHYKIGSLYLKARNKDEANNSFQNCLKIDPNFVPVFRELGELYHSMRKTSEAKESYAKYISLAESNVTTLTRYASFLFLTKDYEGTKNLLEQVLKLDTSNSVVFRLMGYSSYESGNFAKSEEAMEGFFRRTDPSKILASDYEYYGKALIKTAKDSIGIINLRKAIDADSTNFPLHTDIAQILHKQKKYPEAAAEYALKIAADPNKAADYFSLGQSLYFARQYNNADTAFSKVAELKPTVHLGYFWRGRCNTFIDTNLTTGISKQMYEKTVEIISVDSATILKYKKEIIESYKYLAVYYANKDDEKQSLEFYKKILAIDPTDLEAKQVIEGRKPNKTVVKPK